MAAPDGPGALPVQTSVFSRVAMVTGNRIVPCRLGFYCNGRHRTRLSPEKGVHAVRTGAVLLHKTAPPPNRRSTRPGCDICPAIRTEAVLLHKNRPSSRP